MRARSSEPRTVTFWHVFKSCLHCASPFLRAGGGSRLCLRCASLCSSASMRSVRAVRKAIAAGELSHFSALYCVDCGAFADRYEHRDYAEPLKVDPVCRSCNARRGHALPFSKLCPGLTENSIGRIVRNEWQLWPTGRVPRSDSTLEGKRRCPWPLTRHHIGARARDAVGA